MIFGLFTTPCTATDTSSDSVVGPDSPLNKKNENRNGVVLHSSYRKRERRFTKRQLEVHKITKKIVVGKRGKWETIKKNR